MNLIQYWNIYRCIQYEFGSTLPRRQPFASSIYPQTSKKRQSGIYLREKNLSRNLEFYSGSAINLYTLFGWWQAIFADLELSQSQIAAKPLWTQIAPTKKLYILDSDQLSR